MINKTYLYLLLFLLVAFLFTITGNIGSLLSWIICLFIGDFFAKQIGKDVKSIYDFKLCYLLISIAGLFICVDNQIHFDELFGFAADDKRFFSGIPYLLGYNVRSEYTYDIPYFSYFLCPYAFVFSLFKELSLLDLLPINWILFGLSLIMIDKLSRLLLTCNIPYWLMLVCFCFKISIWDSELRFYRDNLILFFILLAVFFLYRDRSLKKFFLYSFPILPLRLASFSFPLLIYVYGKFGKLSTWKIVLSTVVILYLFFVLYKSLMPFFVIYGSGLNNLEKYQFAFSNLDTEQIIEMRNSGFIESDKYERLGQNDLVGILGRAFLSYLYPLSFVSPMAGVPHYEKGIITGFYFSNVFLNISVFSGIVCMAFMISGFKKLVKNKPMLLLFCALIFYYVLIIMVSNQARHMIPFWAMNVILINYIQVHVARSCFWVIFSLLFVIVLFYNLL